MTGLKAVPLQMTSYVFLRFDETLESMEECLCGRMRQHHREKSHEPIDQKTTIVEVCSSEEEIDPCGNISEQRNPGMIHAENTFFLFLLLLGFLRSLHPRA